MMQKPPAWTHCAGLRIMIAGIICIWAPATGRASKRPGAPLDTAFPWELGDDQGTVRTLSGGRAIVPNPGRSTFAVYERDALEVRPAQPGGARTPCDERAVRVPVAVLPPGQSLGLAAISAGQRLLPRCRVQASSGARASSAGCWRASRHTDASGDNSVFQGQGGDRRELVHGADVCC